jgi:hypothetical protein
MINENDEPKWRFLVNALTLGLFGSVGALSFIQASYALVMYLKNWPTDANMNSKIMAR